jgi:hypothetical protein
MRRVGDPLVDPLVSEYVARHPSDAGSLLGALFRTSRMPENHALVAAYAKTLPAIVFSAADRARIERGQRVFELLGPEILLVLGTYALPLAYAAGDGVQVVYRARRLKEDPVRRLCDTAQMVINVMQPGQLDDGGVGWYSTRKVRLIHALVRHHVQTDPANPWSMAWGVPINQEDQAGTLMSFSVAVLGALKKMGAKIGPEDSAAYVFAWTAIGRMLGIDESLLPASENEAATLARRIGERQFRPTPEGKELTEQLLGVVERLSPVNGYALSLTHFFVDDGVFGPNVASALQLPAPNWTKRLVSLRAAQKRVVLGLLDRVPGARRRRSFVARRFAQALILLQRPDKNVPFEVPAKWRAEWRTESGS